MKFKDYFSDSEGKIASYLEGIDSSVEPPQSFYTDSMKEFWQLKHCFSIPEISVKSLEYKVALKFLREIVEELAPFLIDHEFLPKRRPHREEHAIHFAKPLSGKVLDFVHVVRLDFKYSPELGTILSSGTTDFYPSYRGNRVFYKSRLVPVKRGGDFRNIDSLRLEASRQVETDYNRFSAVIFDEGGVRKKSIEYMKMLDSHYFAMPIEVYQPLCFDYMTLCLNIPQPLGDILNASLELFEPLFLFYALCHNVESPDIQAGSPAFSHCFSNVSGKWEISSHFGARLKSFFRGYSLGGQDDGLHGVKALKMQV